MLVYILYGILLLIIVAFVTNEFYAQKLKASPMPTLPWVRREIIRALKDEVGNREDLLLYELGSGWGGLAVLIARAFPKVTVHGFEISPVPFVLSKLRQRKNLRFYNRDVFTLDLSGVDVIAVYLTPWHLERLVPKMKAEMKAGSLIVASGFALPDMEPEKTVFVKGALEKAIYVYRIK
jgi:trans-aconitate methyltransferase